MYIEIENAKIEEFKNKEVILFGAGSCGLRAVEEIERVGAKVIGFCDNNLALAGKKIKKYTIIAPEDLYSYPKASIIITSTYDKEIKKQLNEMKITNCYVAKVGVLKATIPFDNFKNQKVLGEGANEYIYNGLMADSPFFVGRLGSVELECISHYLYFLDRKKQMYPSNVKMIMNINAGFFPKEDELLDKFSELYIENIKDMNMIWSMWSSKYEDKIYQDFVPKSIISPYDDSYLPIDYKIPWTKALCGKKILVIHPFEMSIKENYKNITKIYPNGFLPEFELITVPAVQSIAGTKTNYSTWFDALESMKLKIEKTDFDIALIGAGAYGLSLGSYVKQLGKKAVHVGGALQLYFGIKGKAWDKLGIYNEYFTSPKEEEKPQGFKMVEAGRYW